MPAFYTPGGHRRYRRGDLEAFLERSGPGGAQPSGPTVLIVDDDAGLREFVRASLELEGYTCARRRAPSEGLAALERGPAGPDPARRDDAADGRLGDAPPRPGAARVGAIPVVMFSGQVDEQRGRRGSERGASGFIGKPFDPQQLLDRAKQILGARPV